MLESSHEIHGTEAKKANAVIKQYQDLYIQAQDLEQQLKPIKKQLDELKEQIMSFSVAGLNETTVYAWKMQVNADSYSISAKTVQEKEPVLFEELLQKNLVNTKKGAKSIKDITKK